MPATDSDSALAVRAPPARVLTVFAHAQARRTAREALQALSPLIHCQDAAGATHAMLALLSSRFDLVLVDVAGVGDLLHALLSHVRRAAPRATVLCFGVVPAPAAGWGDVHSWDALAALLGHWHAGRETESRPVL